MMSVMSMASTTVVSSVSVVPPAMMATTMSGPPLFSLVPTRLLQFVPVSLGMCPTPTLAPMVSFSGSSKCVSVVVIFFKLAQLDKPVDDFAYGFFVIRRELFTPGTMNLLDDR
jgi:hypothetical protein